MAKLKIVLTVLLVSSFLLSGCSKKKSEKHVLKLAHSLSTKHPVHKALEYMSKEVYEKSEGKLKIDVYPGGQLGSERECIEQLQLGALAMTKTSTGPLESFVPEVKVLGLPYIFRDKTHKDKILKGKIGKELLAAGEKVGLKGLCFYDAGARSFYTTNNAIRTPEDLEGMKIRVQQSHIAMKMIEAMGASPTPIDWGELYTSLQQGVVDGAENNPPSFYESNHYQICKYYTLDEHTQPPDMVLISTAVWNKLSPELQQALNDAVAESVPYYEELWNKRVAESLAKVREAGVEVIIPDKEPFIEAVKSMYGEFKGTNVGKLADRIRAVK